MKAKQLKEWSITELEDFAFAIQYIYIYLDRNAKEERTVLNTFYDKICEWVNSQKRGTIINPGYLRKIDRER